MAVFHLIEQQSQRHIMWDEASLPRKAVIAAKDGPTSY